MVKRGANTISNKVVVRACPNSDQSAHFPHGECRASCAVSQSACRPDGEMVLKNLGENGRGVRNSVIQGAVPTAGTQSRVGVYERPGKAWFEGKEVGLCGFVW